MIYFDNAATGFPKSKEVISATEKAMKLSGNPGRSEHFYSIYSSEILYMTREKLAETFETTPERIVLCPSATYALNIAIKGLKKTNSKVLISDMEHNSVIRAASADDTTLIFQVDINNDENTINNFKNILFNHLYSESGKSDDCISVVALTHASNVCGRILPIEKIAKICNQNKIPVVLDASQTAGYIPIKFSDSFVDVICIPGHKGFYGPMGTGALIVNPKSEIEFKTIIEGGTGIYSNDIHMPTNLPERLEAGTIGVHDFAGLLRAIQECTYTYKDMMDRYVYLLNEFKNIPEIILYGISYENIDKYMPIILFNVKNLSAQSFAQKLFENGICVRSGFHCSPLAHEKLKTGSHGAIRVSVGKTNSFKECKKLIDTIKLLISKT